MDMKMEDLPRTNKVHLDDLLLVTTGHETKSVSIRTVSEAMECRWTDRMIAELAAAVLVTLKSNEKPIRQLAIEFFAELRQVMRANDIAVRALQGESLTEDELKMRRREKAL